MSFINVRFSDRASLNAFKVQTGCDVVRFISNNTMIYKLWAEPAYKAFSFCALSRARSQADGGSHWELWVPPPSKIINMYSCTHMRAKTHGPPGKRKEHLCVSIHLCGWLSPGRPSSFSFPDNGFPRNALELMSCEALFSSSCGVINNGQRGKWGEQTRMTHKSCHSTSARQKTTWCTLRRHVSNRNL